MQPFSIVLSEIFAVHRVTPPIKTIVICDPGVDDALMLLQILSNKNYQVVGVIPVEGNASSKVTLNNTLNICEYVDYLDVAIYPSAQYFVKNRNYINVAPIYGIHGLAGLVLPSAKKLRSKKQSGMAFACAALEKEPHLIISTGPLTELSNILVRLSESNPSALRNIIGLSIMGGVINPVQEANWPVSGRRYTEANFAYHKRATRNVFEISQQFNIPIFLSPLDVTHSVLASASDVKPLKKLRKPLAKLAYNLISHVPLHYQIRYNRGPDGNYRQPLHDVHASNCLVNPKIYYGDWVSECYSFANDAKKHANKNIFLLDVHYLNRGNFFNEIIAGFK